MQSKFTQKILRRYCIRVFTTVLILFAFLQNTNSQILFNEGFDVAAPLPAGWAMQNLSSPLGIQPSWFQGNDGVFPSNSGATTSYIAANFQNGAGLATLSDWLFAPNVTLKDGDIFSFYTRGTGSTFPDRLQVRMSTNGASVNAGASETSVGDFTTLLLDINPSYSVGVYPSVWTQYNITISGLGGIPTSGRIAFRYFVENGGPNGANSDYIGVDDVKYTTFAGACAGTPAVGNTVSSQPSVCSTTSFTLSATGIAPVSGLTYQWQSSPNGTTWTNISGATSANLTLTQGSSTFYQLLVTCSGNTANSTPLQVPMSPATSCYCLAGSPDQIFEKIGNVTLNTINNTSFSTLGYEDFTAISTNLLPGFPYPMSVSIAGAFNTDQVIVFIDYNHNGVFTDAGETVFTSAPGVGPMTTTLIVPMTALSGPTRMRVRMHDSGGFTPNPTSCGDSDYGQVEDYTVNILPVVPCSGTPTPGNTISNVTTACPGSNINLSLQNFTSGSGVTYQWQSGPSATGPFTDIAGATSSIYTTTQTAATWYQANVTCSGNTVASTPVLVQLTPFTNCYCTSVAGSTADEDIFNVTLNTLNNSSNCASVGPGPGSIKNRYSNYRSGAGAPATPDVIQGSSNPFSVQVGTCGGNYTNSVAAWIDFNHDGVFGTTERVYVSPGGTVGPHTENGFAVIPSTALLGVTGMRVISNETGTPTSTTPCGAYNWGETEDYLVNIIPCVQGALTSQPVNASMACGGTTSFSVNGTGSLLTYQWEYRTTPTGPWLAIPTGSVYSGQNSSTLTITNGSATLNGYQYRAIMSGACTAPDPSNFATLTVTPYLAPITPVPAVKCETSNLHIFASPPPTVTSVCSPTLNITIPDGQIAGISNSMNVSGIPAGATITNVSIKVNVNHTYVADLMLVVKAPNGKILNLSNLIGGGNNPGVNFTNTVFSSATGLPALNTGTSPGYTGTFKPDAAPAIGAFGIPSGPTGFASNTQLFSDLMVGNMNGTWTIAMYDAGPPDQGTLVDWCVNITWGVPPATGIFSPVTDLWLDAAATIPYTGTAVNSVYTSTATSTTYSVVVSNGTCTSAATSVPVTVTAPLTTVTVPATTSVCDGNTVTISATAATGTASVINYQWEVSTDGITYTTVSNGGIYSGATTGTLTITGASNAINGYRYRVKASIPACGSNVTSARDSLIVNPNPVISLTVSPYTALTPGMTTTLTATSIPGATYTWYRDGVIVPNNSTNTLIVDVDGLGEYTATVSDVNTCNGTSNAITIRDSSSNIVFIYPSPNTGQFQVRFRSVQGNVNLPRTVNIYDAKGSRIYSRNYPINVPYERLDVDLRNHGKGVYMVELADRNGNRIKAGRVIVL